MIGIEDKYMKRSITTGIVMLLPFVLGCSKSPDSNYGSENLTLKNSGIPVVIEEGLTLEEKYLLNTVGVYTFLGETNTLFVVIKNGDLIQSNSSTSELTDFFQLFTILETNRAIYNFSNYDIEYFSGFEVDDSVSPSTLTIHSYETNTNDIDFSSTPQIILTEYF